MKSIRALPVLILAATSSVAVGKQDDMDFIAEHLPEAAMDARLLGLPVSYADDAPPAQWSVQLQTLATRIESGNVALSGAGVGLGLRQQLARRWSVLGLAFFDRLDVSGSPEERLVAPIFSLSFPASLPAQGMLTNQRGDVSQTGAGLALRYEPRSAFDAVVIGATHMNVRLSDYRVDYRLTSGPSTGLAGTLDYSARYSYWIPFAEFEWRIARPGWQFTPRFMAGMPMPRRGWRGRMEGPGFDIRGDTAAIGHGKHMGDPFAGFGLGVTYVPWHVTIDAGALLNQAVLEPRIHSGIDRAWLLSLGWQPD